MQPASLLRNSQRTHPFADRGEFEAMEGRDQIQPATHCSSPPGVADIQMRVTTVKKVGEGWWERWRVGGRERLVEAVRLLK